MTRFGYQAVGNADLMRALGKKYDIPVQVVELVTTGDREIELPPPSPSDNHEEGEEEGALVDSTTIISSSKITSLLSGGHMSQVSKMLGRKYRLIADVSSSCSCSFPLDCFLNMVPGAGKYQVVLSTSEEASLTTGAATGKAVAEVGAKDLVLHTESPLDLKNTKLLSIDFL
jgi:FAD synthase